MGDISELRGLVVTIGFLSALILILLWLPHGLFAESIMEAREYSSPEDFDVSEIMAWNKTYQITFNDTMDVPYHIEDEEVGHDLWLWMESPGGEYWIALEHIWQWWIHINHHEMEWYDSGHTSKISRQSGYLEILDIETLDGYTYGSVFYAECEHFQLKISFSYNTTTYSSHEEAIDDDALTMSFGVEWEIEQTSYNAWDLIAMLLTFSLPNVHVLINALIAIPIWACIAYLCYVLIIKVIPLIAGG